MYIINTFITGVSVIVDIDNLVGVAKNAMLPIRPIKCSSAQMLCLHLLTIINQLIN